MQFNKEKFILETAGSLEAALHIIDELVEALNKYISEDEVADCEGGGCFGRNAENQVMSFFKDKQAGEYLKN